MLQFKTLFTFNKKKKDREQELVDMYDKGGYLRVDKDIDNKKLIEDVRNGK